MQKVLTEADLRCRPLPDGTTAYRVEPDVFVTPLAEEYLRDRGIELVRSASSGMSRTPVTDRGGRTYIDAATGEGYRCKPEEMTHLRGNRLVPKTHPRIRLRGRLDLLEAHILECQLLAGEQGLPELCVHLGEVLDHVRQVLGAEVKELPLKESPLFGLSREELRRISHHVESEIGIPHPIPHHAMGRMALSLNTLRGWVRETELVAAGAFSPPEPSRPDILEELNRLSSGVYILFCRLLAGYYGGEAHG